MLTNCQKLYQIKAIRELERIAIHELHIAEQDLMERAGNAVFQLLQQLWPKARRIAVFCGKGNNGGDGYVVARLAKQAGLVVTVYQLAPFNELKDPALTAAQACQHAGVTCQLFSPAIDIAADVIVDALLGIGITAAVTGAYQQAIAAINKTLTPVLAIDIPSGIEGDTGNARGEVVHATATITLIGPKLGLFTGQGKADAGTVYCDDLNLPNVVFARVIAAANLLSPDEINTALPSRRGNTHKGNYGHVLIIGGDYGMAGAVRMAAEAAARVGAGLVSVATRPEHIDIVSAMRPEVMCHGINGSQDLIPLMQKATVLVIGPGLGKSEWSLDLWQTAIASELPKLLDADALNLLAQKPYKKTNWVLTPHPGEAARLLQITTAELQGNRFSYAEQLQQRFGGVCVLKGAGTLIQSAKGLPALCSFGNPGMASGGMGDVLSGVIGGLLAQNLSLETAARVGVLVHSRAADQAAQAKGERGLLALDLMDYLRKLVNLCN